VKDVAGQSRLVPAVDRSGNDVEIATENRGVVRVVVSLKERQQTFEPRQLAGKVVVIGGLTVGALHGGEGEIAELSGDEPRAQGLLLGKPPPTTVIGVRDRIATPCQLFWP
jgi:hypothetical protein